MSIFNWEYISQAYWKREARSIALWISLNLFNLVVTMSRVVAIDGSLVELNPIVTWIGGNIAGLVGYELALTLLAIVILSYIRRLHLLIWLNMIMAAVVVWNLAWLGIS